MYVSRDQSRYSVVNLSRSMDSEDSTFGEKFGRNKNKK